MYKNRQVQKGEKQNPFLATMTEIPMINQTPTPSTPNVFLCFRQALDPSSPPWEAVMTHRTPGPPDPAQSVQSEKDSVLSWRFPSRKYLQLSILLLFLLWLFRHNWGVGRLFLQVGQEVADLTTSLKQEFNSRQEIRANRGTRPFSNESLNIWSWFSLHQAKTLSVEETRLVFLWVHLLSGWREINRWEAERELKIYERDIQEDLDERAAFPHSDLVPTKPIY